MIALYYRYLVLSRPVWVRCWDRGWTQTPWRKRLVNQPTERASFWENMKAASDLKYHRQCLPRWVVNLFLDLRFCQQLVRAIFLCQCLFFHSTQKTINNCYHWYFVYAYPRVTQLQPQICRRPAQSVLGNRSRNWSDHIQSITECTHNESLR